MIQEHRRGSYHSCFSAECRHRVEHQPLDTFTLSMPDALLDMNSAGRCLLAEQRKVVEMIRKGYGLLLDVRGRNLCQGLSGASVLDSRMTNAL